VKDVEVALRRPAAFAIRRPGRGDERDAQEITDLFLEWRAGRASEAPYFAFLNYIDAHQPLRPPESYRKRYGRPRSQRALYDAEIAYIDHEVGRLLSSLEQRGELRNTLVIVTADHGEHFGERGLRGHQNSVYTQTVHVPLVMRLDGHIPLGIRVRPVVSLRDLGATVLHYAGVPTTPPFPGTSLSRYWSPADDSGSTAVAQLARQLTKEPDAPDWLDEVAVFDDRWHLVLAGTRPLEELFDYRADPIEARNLIGAETASGVPERLRILLRKSLQSDIPAGFQGNQQASRAVVMHNERR
jgi:arylsulfatase A-like enzyme